MRVVAIYILLFVAFSLNPTLQVNAQAPALKSVIAKIDSVNVGAAKEKVFLHLDKQSYITGDTLRFSAYLLDDELFSSLKSGLLYVELISDSISVVKRQALVLTSGVAHGDIIIKTSYPTGGYTIRAYTNWMRNNGEESFFTQRLSILSSALNKKKSARKNKPEPPQKIDLQFMPEGGNLLADVLTRIAFKAIDEHGIGTDISGAVFADDQQQIAPFRSTHKGMGSFEITPQPGKLYTAKIMLNGVTQNYALPAVSPSGIVLKVEERSNDSLRVIINATNNLTGLHSVYYLIAEARSKICYAAKVTIKQQRLNFDVAKKTFPTGVVKFVLLDSARRPVTQRLVFVDRLDALQVVITSNKKEYALRDSIDLQLQVTDKNGAPVEGLFSIAVTDDNQVTPTPQDAQNIVNYMLLHPDINGTIEDPGYYFDTRNGNRGEALDLLLLTQGWAGYDWRQLFGRSISAAYQAEPEFRVTGRASNVFGFSIANTEVELISTHPLLTMKTRTDKNGRFSFSGFPFLDTINFHIRPKRAFNVGLKVDYFVPPEFTKPLITIPSQSIANDSTLINAMRVKKEQEANHTGAIAGKLLNEVNIRKGSIIRPRPTFRVEEEEVRVARPGSKRFSVGDLLYKYDIRAGRMVLLIDGRAPTDPPATAAWLYQHTVEDIKSVTTITMPEYLLINVTTNSGKGEVLAGLQGHAYHPMPISWPHSFYSPRYAAKTSNNNKDARSTVYWNPTIITDTAGKARVSFYSADLPGKYSVVLNGATLNGAVGFARQSIAVNPDL
nr:hypothetical protein [uncultured Mucilaginibacter sp.]